MITEGMGISNIWGNIDMKNSNYSVRDGLKLLPIGLSIQLAIGIYLEILTLGSNGKRVHPCFFLGCPWTKKVKGCRKNRINLMIPADHTL